NTAGKALIKPFRPRQIMRHHPSSPRPFSAFTLLAALFCASIASLASAAQDPFDGVAKAYLVRAGGENLWEQDAGRQLPPASLTKVMTALLILEDYKPNEVITVSTAAAAETGSRIGLRAGDRMTVADLLAATLICSAN